MIHIPTVEYKTVFTFYPPSSVAPYPQPLFLQDPTQRQHTQEVTFIAPAQKAADPTICVASIGVKWDDAASVIMNYAEYMQILAICIIHTDTGFASCWCGISSFWRRIYLGGCIDQRLMTILQREGSSTHSARVCVSSYACSPGCCVGRSHAPSASTLGTSCRNGFECPSCDGVFGNGLCGAAMEGPGANLSPVCPRVAGDAHLVQQTAWREQMVPPPLRLQQPKQISLPS